MPSKKFEQEREEIMRSSGVSADEAFARKDMGFSQREKTARLECEKDGLDPDAPFVNPDGTTTVCGENGELFPNHEYYDLVLSGYAPRPVTKRRVS